MKKEIKSKLEVLQISLDYLKESYKYSNNESLALKILASNSRQVTIKTMQTMLISLLYNES
jgi:hypothetical protein